MGKTKSHSFAGLCISSASGSGGKTLLSLGLGRELHNRGHVVQGFKKGPDYIDSAWLAAATHTPTSNLDPFFQDDSGLKSTFHAALARSRQTGKKQFALLEGNRGLYDGLDENGSCSTAKVARVLNLPILLCLNTAKMTRTIAALLQGLLQFEEGLEFCGIVLNNVGSKRHETSLIKSIDCHVGLPVLGVLPRLPHNPLPERHMGIASNGKNDVPAMNGLLEALASLVRENCDVDNILAKVSYLSYELPQIQPKITLNDKQPTIGYIKDAALWFYYPENLSALEEAGATLARLSLLDPWDYDAWANLDGLYIGGGFPEDYARLISGSPALQFIKKRAQSGMPVYAECGGLSLLGKELEVDNKKWPMANIFPISLALNKKPQGLGYVEGTVTGQNPFFPNGHLLRGHEFHYTACTAIPEEYPTALKMNRGQGLAPSKKKRDALTFKNVWASYTHIFAPAEPDWAKNFISISQSWRKVKK